LGSSGSACQRARALGPVPKPHSDAGSLWYFGNRLKPAIDNQAENGPTMGHPSVRHILAGDSSQKKVNPCPLRGLAKNSFNLVQSDIGMVTDAALGGAAGQVVLHAVAFVRLNFPVVHAHGDGNDQLPLGLFQNRSQALIELEVIGGNVELLLGDLKWIQGLLGQYGCCTHAFSLY
jgi:hypothetical protein